MDEEHFLVYVDKVEDWGCIGAAVLLVTDVADYFQGSDPILGSAHSFPQFYREELHLHLGRRMLHHEVVDLLGILIPPFLLIMGVILLPLPLCCLGEVGRIGWIVGEADGWLLELTNGQRNKRTVNLQTVCNVLREGLNVEVERGRRLGCPRVVEDYVFVALRGRSECLLSGGEGTTPGHYSIVIPPP